MLSAGQKELFPRRAYEILQESDGEARGEFFDLFGDMLSSRHLLSDDQRLIDRVCRPILNAGNAMGLAWLAKIVDSEPALLIQHSDQAAVNDFKGRVQQRLDDTLPDAPIFPDLKRIGIVFGIERIERRSSEAEPEARPEDTGEASE